MIKEFNNIEIRPSAIVYQSMLTQVKKRYAKDPEQAGELAISFLEFVLTGAISSDDDVIEGFVEGYRANVTRAAGKYDAKVAATVDALRPIADMYKKGMKQVEIARALDLQPPAISKKLALIRAEYPFLLEENVSENLESDEGEIVSNVSGNFRKVSKVAESSGNVSKNEEMFPESSGNVSKKWEF